jgi:hypothetical protein
MTAAFSARKGASDASPGVCAEVGETKPATTASPIARPRRAANFTAGFSFYLDNAQRVIAIKCAFFGRFNQQ